VSGTDRAIADIRRALDSGRLTVNPLDDGGGVVLDIDGEQLMTLNPSGMCLVRALEAGAADAGTLRDALCRDFEVEPARAEADAGAFVGEIAGAL